MRKIILLLVLIMTACTQSPTGAVIEEPIKIGFIGPLTGNLAYYGEQQVNALELVRREGVNIRYEDGECASDAALKAAQRLHLQGIRLIIGPTCSGATLAVAPFANQEEILIITPVAGSDDISNAGPYIFRNFIPNSQYARVAASYLEQEGIDDVGLLYIQNEFGMSMAKAFMESYGGEIKKSAYHEENKDFRSMLLTLKETDAILLAGYHPDGALILEEAKELGIETPFFGLGDPYDNEEFLSLSKGSGEGFRFFSVPEKGQGEAYQGFAQRYEKTYGEEPPIYAAYAYDSLLLLLDAIDNCGDKDVRCIKGYLHGVTYRGASNMIRFDRQGDLETGKIALKTIRNGEIVEVAVLE
jgi:branched-chain amino acid transport system substrate-binding protein